MLLHEADQIFVEQFRFSGFFCFRLPLLRGS
jgi:hypothetical protein